MTSASGHTYTVVSDHAVELDVLRSELSGLRQQFTREYAQVMGALTDLRNMHAFLEREHLKLKKLVLDTQNIAPKLEQRFSHVEVLADKAEEQLKKAEELSGTNVQKQIVNALLSAISILSPKMTKTASKEKIDEMILKVTE